MERIWNAVSHLADRVWSFRLINVRIVIGSFLTVILGTFIWCLYLSKSSQPILKVYKIPNLDHEESICNFFDGRWVSDASYPLYNASLCPFVEQGFNCLANGRGDIGYLKWRWQPNNCNIPPFDVSMILEKLRGKRVVFVGDSLSRTQWESMICMLMTGVDDKSSVYEVNGNKITKKIRNLRVRFSSYDLRVEFYRSIFLVQPSTSVSKRAPKRVKSLIQLDKLQDTSNEWLGSDILVFNSAHWWTPTKLFEMGCYFQVGGKMKLGMPIQVAYRTALATLGNWLEKNIEPNKTQVFFRTFESAHWSQQTCNVTMQPLSEANGIENNPFSDIIRDTMNNLLIPVTALHVTPMSAFRSDAHVGTWSDNPLVPDCSHWCLPGVPDTWNEILFAYILKPGRRNSVG